MVPEERVRGPPRLVVRFYDVTSDPDVLFRLVAVKRRAFILYPVCAPTYQCQVSSPPPHPVFKIDDQLFKMPFFA